MKLCASCNQHYEDDRELCPVHGVKLLQTGIGVLVGKTLEDRYRILCTVGQGSMGTVYKAVDETTGREMAIKLLHSTRMGDPNAQRRFLREAKTISTLNHPNIVKLFNFGRYEEEQPYIITEFLKGKTLSSKIRESGHIPLAEALTILRQVVDAVGEAHRAKIIHRDLKPDNIVLEDNVVKVLDFGVAKMVQVTGEHTGALTVDGKVCGSPGYMSPEQCRGEELDFRSDIYSLGIVLFEMLTGSRPFHADDVMGLMFLHVNKVPPSLSSTRVDLAFPQALEKVVAKALSKSRKDRQQTVEQLWDEIDAATRGVLAQQGKRQASGWIPFETELPRLLSLERAEQPTTVSQDELIMLRRVSHKPQTGKTAKPKLPRGFQHTIGFMVVSLVSFVLLFAALKLSTPDGSRPEFDRVIDMVASGQLDRALSLLDKLRRQKLAPEETETVNEMLMQVAMKYAQNKQYSKASETLMRVPKASRNYTQARALVKKYRRGLSAQQ